MSVCYRLRTHLIAGLWLALALAVAAGPSAATAAAYWWDPTNTGGTSGGGSGPWDNSTANWWSSGTAAWTNTGTDQAIFGGTGGTVALTTTTTIYANTLTFNSGYTLSGGGLSLTGVSPTIDTGDYSITINSSVAGAAFTKVGSGLLTLIGSSSYTGATRITQGTLQLGGAPVGALASYSFDNISGTGIGSTVVNSGLGNSAYNGTLYGTATIAVGAGIGGGNAMSLASVGDDGMFLGTGGVSVSNGVFTASMWFYGMYGGAYRCAFRNWTGGSRDVYFLDGSQNLAAFSDLPPAGFRYAASPFSMTPYTNQAAWHMLTVAGDGTNSTYYVDGTQAGSSIPWACTSTIGDVGGQYQQANRMFAQYIDNVSVYQSTLSASQVLQLYNATGPQSQLNLPAGSQVSLAASATLDVADLNVGIGPLSDDSGAGGTVNLHANTLTINSTDTSGNPVNSVFSGQIVGTGGSLKKTGSGTLTLAGSNTYSGNTTISTGALQLANTNAAENTTVSVGANNALQFGTGVGTFVLGGLTGGGGVALQDTGGSLITLQVGNNGTSASYAGSLSGSGSLVKLGTGTLTLAGSGTFTGTTTVNAGTLALANSLALQQSAFNSNGTGTLGFGTLAAATLGGVLGTGGLALQNTVFTPFTLTLSSTGPMAVSAVLSGTGNLAKSGTGILLLAGSNTYSGATTISAGALQLANANAAQNSTLTIGANASLQFGTGVGTFTLGALSGSASFSLQDTMGGAVNLQVGNNGADAISSGNISGAGGLVKIGTGTMTLLGNNSYAGTTRVTQGTLQLGIVAPAGAVAYYSFDNVSGTGALSTVVNSGTGGATYTGALFGTATIAVGAGLNGGNAMTIGASSANGDGLYVGTAGVSVSNGVYTASMWFSGLYGNNFGGAFKNRSIDHWMYILDNTSSTRNLEVWNDGAWYYASPPCSMATYVNTSTWHMLTVVGDGTNSTFYVDGVKASGSMPWVATTDIGQIGGQSGHGDRNFAKYIGNASIYQSALGTAQIQQLYLSGASNSQATLLPTTSPVTVALGATLDVVNAGVTVGALGDDSGAGGTVNLHANTLTINSADGSGSPVNSLFSGQIVGNGGSLVKGGSGTLALGGANTYSGPTTISSGTLQVSNANALQYSSVSVSANSSLTFGTGVGTFTIGGLTGGGNVALQDTGGSPVTLQVGNNGAGGSYNGSLSGAGGLVKTGSGVFVLLGSSTYTGSTRVAQGTLQLGGVPSGAVAYYAFDNVSGTAIINAGTGGAAYNGSLFGTATLAAAPGLNGRNAMNLASLGADGLFLGTSGVGVSNGVYTASMWFYSMYGSSDWRCPLNSIGGTREAYLLYPDDSQNLDVYSDRVGGLRYSSPALSMKPYRSQSAWHMLTIVGDGSNSTFYIDGSATGSTMNFVSMTNIGEIGGQYNQPNRNFAQYVADVYVSQSALSADQVRQLYISSNPLAQTILSTASPVSVASGATLDVMGHGIGIGPLSDDSGAGGTVNIHGNTLTITSADTTGNPVNSSFSGQIVGTGGALVKTGSGTLSLLGTNTFTGGITINAGTLSISADAALGGAAAPLTFSDNGGLQAAAPLALGSARTIFLGTGATAHLDSQGYAMSLASTITGSGGLVKRGSGTLALSNTSNNYSGGTSLNAGTLAIDSDAELGAASSPLAFTGNATLQATGPLAMGAARGISVGSGATGTFDPGGYAISVAGSIGGSGSLALGGSGTLTLAGGNTFTGGMTVSAGTATLSGSGTLGAAGGSLNVSGGVLDLAATTQTVGMATLAGGAIQNGTLAAATFYGQSGSLVNLSLAGVLTKTTSGTLVLSGTNSFSGGSALAAGELSVSSDQNLGAGSPIAFGGGLLRVTGAAMTILDGHIVNWSTFNGGFDIVDAGNTFTVTGAIAGAGSLTKTGSGTLVLASVAATFTGGTIVKAGVLQVGDGVSSNGGLGGDNSQNGNVDLSAAAALRFANPLPQSYSGAITGSGSVIKTGSGTLVLGGSNSFTGGLTINGGTLQVADANALGPSGCTVTLIGGTLELAGTSPAVGTLNASLSTTIALNAATLAVGDGDANSILSGTITGSGGGLAVHGTGTTLLSGSNSFTSPTTLGDLGTLTLANSQALSLSTLDYGGNGGKLSFGTLTAVTLGGLAGTNYSNPLDNRLALTNATGTAVTLRVGNNGADTAFTGDILGSGSLVKIGGGTLTLSGNDSYSGGTTVLGGVLDIASVTSLPGNSTLAIANTAEVIFATDLGSAVQLSLMLPGAGGGDSGLTYFHVSTNPASVPEPSTLMLLAAAAVAGLTAWRRKWQPID
jgi:fibronectin-binding autotransporter adhesin